ncbi:MAG: chorismate synthase [Oscillospiraceae bacterium]
MSSEFGKTLKISVFGQSHGKAIGVVVDGLPTGIKLDMEELYRFMDRRRPGKSRLTTARSEGDVPIILSGVQDGVTCGSPLCAIIENSDTRSKDYSELWDKPRPSHADFTARARYGDFVDMRGSGHFSGRLTAPLCIAGGIAKQILAQHSIFVGAHLMSVGNVEDVPFPMEPEAALFESVAEKSFPVIDDKQGEKMARLIEDASQECDSVGGVVECSVIGLPAGLGSPMFDGIENRLAAAIFGVPAVKGLEFGAGFSSAGKRGSENNDPFIISDGAVKTSKNDSGGILGGITTGMPVIFKAAIKPTASISKPQQTVSLSNMQPAELIVHGRHDPCIALRAVPVIEAVAASVILDIILEEE